MIKYMNNKSLDDLSVFVEVARANGFRAAADNLNLAAGSVSEAIQRIEKRLGVRLIERTTRRISLTSAGQKLFERSLPALADLASAIDDVGEDQNLISGTLRLSAPRSSSAFFLDDAITNFCLNYPTVNVEVIYDDSKVDLVSSGVDAVIRSRTLLEKETHAVEIGPALDMALVVSPAYVERHGCPKKPTDLTSHDGIRFCFGRGDRLAPWSFVTGNKKPYRVNPKPRLVVNDLASMIKTTRTGLGFCYVYRKPAEPYIASGELSSLFERNIPSLSRYTINYLTKRHMPARLRAFIDLTKKL